MSYMHILFLAFIFCYNVRVNCIVVVDSQNNDASQLNMEVFGRVVHGKDGKPLENIKIVLNGEQYESVSQRDGKFCFYNVSSGVYLLDVISIKYAFSQMKLKVLAEEKTVEIIEYKFPGATKLKVEYPILLTAFYENQHFQAHPPFSIISFLLGNPMMTMVVGTGLMMIFFPNIFNMEELSKLQEELSDSSSKNSVTNKAKD